jgi:hypothetical protein
MPQDQQEKEVAEGDGGSGAAATAKGKGKGAKGTPGFYGDDPFAMAQLARMQAQSGGVFVGGPSTEMPFGNLPKHMLSVHLLYI